MSNDLIYEKICVLQESANDAHNQIQDLIAILDEWAADLERQAEELENEL